MKPTSFKITSSLNYLENEILKETGLSHTEFQRKAIDAFLQGKQEISPRLKIKRRSDPNYIRKTVKEPIYLDQDREKKIRIVANREGCGITIVLFQALYDYCIACVMGGIVSKEVIDNIL